MSQIGATPRPWSSPSAWYERRTSVRHAIQTPSIPCEIAAVVGGGYQTGRLSDLSARGATVLVESPLEHGALVTLALKARRGQVERTALAYVVHCNEAGPGEFTVGCQFTLPLRTDEVWSLVS
jgi:hypothetical protein